MQIKVCPLNHIETYTKQFQPDYLISLQAPKADISQLRPVTIPSKRHLIWLFLDTKDSSKEGAPSIEQIAQIIQWGQQHCHYQSKEKILIHCNAGYSRSPAVAYIFWAIYLGAGKEQEAFNKLQESCHSYYYPNRLMIEYADILLGRQGKLLQILLYFQQHTQEDNTFFNKKFSSIEFTPNGVLVVAHSVVKEIIQLRSTALVKKDYTMVTLLTQALDKSFPNWTNFI